MHAVWHTQLTILLSPLRIVFCRFDWFLVPDYYPPFFYSLSFPIFTKLRLGVSKFWKSRSLSLKSVAFFLMTLTAILTLLVVTDFYETWHGCCVFGSTPANHSNLKFSSNKLLPFAPWRWNFLLFKIAPLYFK